jgi:hypothetical protein
MPRNAGAAEGAVAGRLADSILYGNLITQNSFEPLLMNISESIIGFLG